MTSWGYTALVAWLAVLTALVLWAVYSVERSHKRVDALGKRQDTVDDLTRDIGDWWDDQQTWPTKGPERAVTDPALPVGHTDTPHGATAATTALKGSQPLDREFVPLKTDPPTYPGTVAIPAVNAEQAEPFEPETNPETQPAIERRGIGRWVPGPGGSLQYQDPKEKR